MVHMMKRRLITIIVSGLSIYVILLFLLVLAEQQSQGSSINNFFDALWYSIVTFSTVGYGDMYPLSIWGRVIAFLFMFFSIGFLGFIVGKIADVFRKQSEKRRLGLMGTDFINHIIIIGWDSFAMDVTTQLINADKKVGIITNNKDDIDTINQYFCPKEVFVCISDINKFKSLDLLNVVRASAIFLNNGNDSDKLVSILSIKKILPAMKFVIVLDNMELKDTFVNAGVTYVLSKNEIASKLLASYIFEPIVADFTKELITSTSSEEGYDIQQYKVNEKNPYKGLSYRDMFFDLKERYNVISVGLSKKDGRLLKMPNDDEMIEQGDYIVLIANGMSEKIIQKVFNVQEGI